MVIQDDTYHLLDPRRKLENQNEHSDSLFKSIRLWSVVFANGVNFMNDSCYKDGGRIYLLYITTGLPSYQKAECHPWVCCHLQLSLHNVKIIINFIDIYKTFSLIKYGQAKGRKFHISHNLILLLAFYQESFLFFSPWRETNLFITKNKIYFNNK